MLEDDDGSTFFVVDEMMYAVFYLRMSNEIKDGSYWICVRWCHEMVMMMKMMMMLWKKKRKGYPRMWQNIQIDAWYTRIHLLLSWSSTKGRCYLPYYPPCCCSLSHTRSLVLLILSLKHSQSRKVFIYKMSVCW